MEDILNILKEKDKKKYVGTVNRGLSSVSYGKWKKSFVLSKPVSSHINYSIAFM
jgi:hypothetical protein